MARITVLNLMALVFLIALGFAAMRDATEWTEHAVFGSTLLMLVAAFVGAIVRKGSPEFVGFAAFGWAYVVLLFVPAFRDSFRAHLPTTSLVEDVVTRVLEIPPSPPPLPFNYPGLDERLGRATAQEIALFNASVIARSAYYDRLSTLGDRVENSKRIAHCMLALILGFVGAGVGRFLAAWPKRPSALPASGNDPQHHETPGTKP